MLENVMEVRLPLLGTTRTRTRKVQCHPVLPRTLQRLTQRPLYRRDVHVGARHSERVLFQCYRSQALSVAQLDVGRAARGHHVRRYQPDDVDPRDGVQGCARAEHHDPGSQLSGCG
jgi:hypothetical protein